MLFAAAGVALGPEGLGVIEGPATFEGLRRVLEGALVVVLFTDAAAVSSWDWHRDNRIPLRLLSIGMPLSILLGWGLGLVLLPGLPLWEAALLGAILAPTDAALGQAVVASERVPRSIRQDLNVESGLNDGLALPFVTVFLALALEQTDAEGSRTAIETVGLAVVVSPIVGAVVGWLGARALAWAAQRRWARSDWVQIGAIALAVASYAIADEVGGSGFMAAWVAGYTAGRSARSHMQEGTEFAEDIGTLLATVGFLGFGVLLLGPSLAELDVRTVAYAALSLTLVRMVPVAASLLGTGFRPPTVLFLGWFGPRGLASIVFVLLAVEEGLTEGSGLVLAVTATVALSVLLHGGTAALGANRYGAWAERATAARPEMLEAGSIAGPPVRRRLSGGWPRHP
jgi:NhaP-type Na+/H+ or K+/H+ antiporter